MKLTKHWHYVLLLGILIILNNFIGNAVSGPAYFISSAMIGAGVIATIIAWIMFLRNNKKAINKKVDSESGERLNENINNKERNESSQKIIVAVIGIAVLFLGLAFYWFEIRSMNIRKECSLSLVKNSGKWITVYEGKNEIRPASDKEYKSCLRNNGLRE